MSVQIDFVSTSIVVKIVMALNMPTVAIEKNSIKVIILLCGNIYHDGKNPNVKEIK